METKNTPDPAAQPAEAAQTDDYEVPVDPHDGVDCEDCQ